MDPITHAEISIRQQLFQMALKSFENYSRNVLEQSKAMFTDMLKNFNQVDLIDINDSKENLKIYLSALRAYQQSAQQSVMKTVDMMRSFGSIVEKFENQQNPEMKKFLQNHDFPTFISGTQNTFNNWLNEFSNKFEEFANGLNVDEQHVEQRLLQWHNELINENDFGKKLQQFTKFYAIFLEK